MVNSFFCLRLQTGGIIIGSLGAVFSLWYIYYLTDMLTKLDNYVLVEFDTLSVAKKTAFIVMILFMNIAHVAASIFLVIGSIKDFHILIFPWLVTYGISIIYRFVTFCWSLSQPAYLQSTSLLILLSTFSMQIYGWLVVYSLFQKLRTSSHQIANKSGSTDPDKIVIISE